MDTRKLMVATGSGVFVTILAMWLDNSFDFSNESYVYKTTPLEASLNQTIQETRNIEPLPKPMDEHTKDTIDKIKDLKSKYQTPVEPPALVEPPQQKPVALVEPPQQKPVEPVELQKPVALVEPPLQKPVDPLEMIYLKDL